MHISICHSDSERAELFSFRHRIWAQELGVEVQGDAVSQMFDALDSAAINYFARDEGAIIGSLRITDLALLPQAAAIVERYNIADLVDTLALNSIAHVGRLAVDRLARGGICLFAMLQQGMLDSMQRGIRAFCFDSSPYLLRTYEALGAVRTGPAFNDPAMGLKLPMVLVAGDVEYFRALRSPFARVLGGVDADAQASAWRAKRSDLNPIAPASNPDVLLAWVEQRFAREHVAPTHLLSGLTQSQQQQVLARSCIFTAQAEQEIIKPGLREDAVFIVLSGCVEVIDEHAPGRVLATLEPGEFFGEMAWLLRAPRHNRVIARAAAELLLISADVLRQLAQSAPEISAVLMQNLARALAERLQQASMCKAQLQLCA